MKFDDKSPSRWLAGYKFALANFLIGFLALSGTSLDAFEKNWINPAGGSFHEAENWNPPGEPDEFEDAIFNLSSSEPYSVNLNNSLTTFRIIVNTDQVELDLGGNELYLRDSSETSNDPFGQLTGLTVGPFTGDDGMLIVTNGKLLTEAFHMGGQAGSFGRMVLRGAGTEWDNTLHASSHFAARNTLGRAGFASLTVEDGALARIGRGWAAWGAGSEAEMIVRNGGTMIIEGNADGLGRTAGTFSLTVDGGRFESGGVQLARDGSTAVLNLINGGVMETGYVQLAHVDSTATAVISGEGTEFKSTARFVVGNDGDADVLVEDGALLSIAELRVGFWAPSKGLLSIIDSEMVATGAARIGAQVGGEGLVIVDNSEVSSGAVSIGQLTDSVGEIVLLKGSQWKATGEAVVARDAGATGSLSVSEGSLFEVEGTGNFRIAASAQTSGNILVVGEGSVLSAPSRNFFIGGGISDAGGTGIVEVFDGGLFEAGSVLVWETGELSFGTNGKLNADSLSFSSQSGGVLRLSLNSMGETPVSVSGDLSLGLGTATLVVEADEGFEVSTGETLVIMNYQGGVTGYFAGLEEGATINVHGSELRISYGQEVAGSVTLSEGEGGPPPSAGFNAWITGFGLPSELQEAHVDASGDGVSNIEKYAFGMNPIVSSREGLPELGVFSVVDDDEVLLAWNTEGVGTVWEMDATTVAQGVESAVLSLGYGLTASPLANALSAIGWGEESSGFEASLAEGHWFEFTVNAVEGEMLGLSTLSFNLRRVSRGPQTVQWAYSTDGVNFSPIEPPISITATGGDGVMYDPLDLTNIEDLQGVDSATFRLVGWDASGAFDTGRTIAVGRLGGDNLILSGRVISDDVTLGDFPMLTVHKRPGIVGVAVEIEGSFDLINWDSSNIIIIENTETVLRARLTSSINSINSGFLRARVNQTD